MISEILELFKNTYPNTKITLNYDNAWELLVAVVLSAQCTDERVNKVTANLFNKYKSLDDYIKADLHQFEQDIKSTGFFRNKAKNILASAKIVKEKFGGKVPRTMEELFILPGVARKTANIILGNAFGIVVGIAVDTHVHRISQRLRLVDTNKIRGKKVLTFNRNENEIPDYIKDADPNKIEQQLMQVIPREDWFKFTYRVIDHGRAVCKAKNPKCNSCPFSTLCHSSRVD